MPRSRDTPLYQPQRYVTGARGPVDCLDESSINSSSSAQLDHCDFLPPRQVPSRTACFSPRSSSTFSLPQSRRLFWRPSIHSRRTLAPTTLPDHPCFHSHLGPLRDLPLRAPLKATCSSFTLTAVACRRDLSVAVGLSLASTVLPETVLGERFIKVSP